MHCNSKARAVGTQSVFSAFKLWFHLFDLHWIDMTFSFDFIGKTHFIRLNEHFSNCTINNRNWWKLYGISSINRSIINECIYENEITPFSKLYCNRCIKTDLRNVKKEKKSIVSTTWNRIKSNLIVMKWFCSNWHDRKSNYVSGKRIDVIFRWST